MLAGWAHGNSVISQDLLERTTKTVAISKSWVGIIQDLA